MMIDCHSSLATSKTARSSSREKGRISVLFSGFRRTDLTCSAGFSMMKPSFRASVKPWRMALMAWLVVLEVICSVRWSQKATIWELVTSARSLSARSPRKSMKLRILAW